MGTLDVAAVRRVPCRLSFGCTNLALAWPHGGTGMGAVREPILKRFSAAFPVPLEAFGGAPAEYLEPGAAWGVGGRIRTIDDDAIGKAFPNTSAGATTQRKLVTDGPSSTVRAGNWMSGREFVLVLTPEGATHAKSATQPDVDAPFVVLYRALPVMGDPLEIAFNRTDDLGILFAFMGLPHATRGTMAWGKRADLAAVFP